MKVLLVSLFVCFLVILSNSVFANPLFTLDTSWPGPAFQALNLSDISAVATINGTSGDVEVLIAHRDPAYPPIMALDIDTGKMLRAWVHTYLPTSIYYIIINPFVTTICNVSLSPSLPLCLRVRCVFTGFWVHRYSPWHESPRATWEAVYGLGDWHAECHGDGVQPIRVPSGHHRHCRSVRVITLIRATRLTNAIVATPGQ